METHDEYFETPGATSSSEQPVAQTRAVTRVFGEGVTQVVALQGVDLTAYAGELVCLYGRSGSGKSTLLNQLGGLDQPTAGEVFVLGNPVHRMSTDQRSRLRLTDVGVVFQDNNLLGELTAAENIALPLRIRGAGAREAKAQSLAMLERLGIAELADRFPYQMSGGQQQRVGIARGLSGDRQVLLCDEPTGALDSENANALFHLLRQACTDGVCVVIATHDPIAGEYADSVYRMDDGHLSRATFPGRTGIQSAP